MRLAAALLSVLLTAPAVWASWDDAARLRPGERTRIGDSAGTIHTGTFVEATPERIVIRAGQSQEAIERARVRRIEVRSPARRWRNLAIGAAIGLTAGLIADATVGARFRNESGESGAARFATIAGPAALFGGIGAATPGWRTVYRAEGAGRSAQSLKPIP